MFSMCSELTPRAPIPDTRIPQLMQPWYQIQTQNTNVRSVRYNSCAPRLFLHEITLSRAPLPVDSPKQPKHRVEMQTLDNLQNHRFTAFDLDAIHAVISKKMHRIETQGFLAQASMDFGKVLYD